MSRRQTDGTGHTGAAEPAIAVRVLREVLLVILLGEVHRRRLADLGRDLAMAGLVQLLLEDRTALLRRLELLRSIGVDRRTVLRADVVPLAHPLGRVVALPEHAQQLL